MGLKNYLAYAGVVLFFSTSLKAETTTAQVPAQAFQPTATGWVSIQPSLAPQSGKVTTENYFEAGYKFTANTTLTYLQTILSDVYDPTAPVGLAPYTDAGFFRLKLKNIYKSESGNFSLYLEPDVYLPMVAKKREAGHLTTLRNVVRVSQKIGNLNLMLAEIPMYHIYDRPGVIGAKGAVANPIYENRLIGYATYNFTEKFNAQFVALLYSTLSNSMDGAANSNKLSHFLWINPSINYDITPMFSVGIGYYSDNLAKSDLSDLTITEGLEQGIAQLLLSATF